jgi:hypothetical protein
VYSSDRLNTRLMTGHGATETVAELAERLRDSRGRTKVRGTEHDQAPECAKSHEKPAERFASYWRASGSVYSPPLAGNSLPIDIFHADRIHYLRDTIHVTCE